MLIRRRFCLLLPAVAGAALLGRGAHARTGASMTVAVPGPAMGAIVAAGAGDLVELVVDADLPATHIRIGDAKSVEVAAKIRLKGTGEGRDRFLDDARNATRVGSAVRSALAHVHPEHAQRLAANHKAWAKPFARKALAWSRSLQGSKVAGKRIRDTQGRVYLLEWAGAEVSARGGRAPGALAALPGAPAKASLSAYERYLDALVRALV